MPTGSHVVVKPPHVGRRADGLVGFYVGAGYGMLFEIEGDDSNVDSRRNSLHAALDVNPEVP